MKLILQIADALYALPLESVVTMIPVTVVAPLPGATKTVRGGLLYRDTVIPLIETRRLVGNKTSREEHDELITTLVQREKEHVEWLDELASSVKDRREFRKTTDPRRCAFGMWFYSFKPRDPLISHQLAKFEVPHAAIHALGTTVTNLCHEGKHDEAIRQIAEANANEFGHMIKLFGELRAMLQAHIREIAVILKIGTKVTAIVSDDILGLKNENNFKGQDSQLSSGSDYIENVVALDGKSVSLLDTDKIFAIASTVEHDESATFAAAQA